MFHLKLSVVRETPGQSDKSDPIFSQEKKFTLQKAFIGQSLGALMVEFLNIFSNLAKSCDSQRK